MTTLTHRDPNRAALFSTRSQSSSPLPTYGAPSVPSYGRSAGSSPNPYSYNGGMGGSNGGGVNGGSWGGGGNRTAEELESQNDDAIEGLSAKVRMLKDITVNIGTEVRDSSKLLSSMNDSFGEATGLLGGTFRRMKTMAGKQGGRWWYWMIFLIIVFWVFVFTWLWRH